MSTFSDSASILLALCPFYFFLVLVPSWGVGGLMSTIGKIRGWNTKFAFRVSFAVYTVISSVVIWATWSFGDSLISMIGENTFSLILFLSLFCALPVGGIIISPLIILIIRSRYRDIFAKPVVNDQKLSKETNLHKDSIASISVDKRSPQMQPTDLLSNLSNKHLVHIFVSYRRSDSADISGRIYDRLIAKFGRDAVFKDVDSIPLGLDFKEYLDKQVGECQVLLAIIGDRWLDARDSSGNRRLEYPADFVRIEIESALIRNIPVIPLLVRGASMPSEENLPPSLQKLVYRNGIPIRPDPDFHRDMDRLIKALEKYVK